MRGKNLFFFVLGAGLVAAGLWGLSVGALTTFTAGTPIRASEVNNNFTVLRNAIVELEGRTGFGASLTGNANGDAEGSTGVGFKVRNEGELGTAVRGEVATVGWGVRGVAGGSGIGVQGEAAGTSGIGVRGQVATTGWGVRGVAGGAGVGVQGEAAGAGGIGVRGQVATTGLGVSGFAGGAGIGVQGEAAANGIGVRGQVPTTGWGVRGVAGGAGIGVQGEAGTGGAGVLAKSDQGTALLVEGSIGVRGTRPAAFVHTANAGNISGANTIIDNPLTNDDPNAILIITLVGNLNAPIGVFYDDPGGRWRISRTDGGAMPNGTKFNVLVIKRVP
jgi:hypothetical protein